MGHEKITYSKGDNYMVFGCCFGCNTEQAVEQYLLQYLVGRFCYGAKSSYYIGAVGAFLDLVHFKYEGLLQKFR